MDNIVSIPRGVVSTNLIDPRLTFICDTQEVNERGVRLSRYKCLCGKDILRPPSVVNYKKRPLRSCGCLARDKHILTLANALAHTIDINRIKLRKHGMSHSKFYAVWSSMVARCRSTSHRAYKNYGGRGITVCERWLKFQAFYDDMYDSYLEHRERFSPNTRSTTLERINNDRGYSKENCRWATFEEQGRNRRDLVKLTYQGEIMSIEAWRRKLNFSDQVINMRIRKGWSVERTLTTPVEKRTKRAI